MPHFVSLHDSSGRFLASTASHPDWPPKRLRGVVAWETSHPDDRALVTAEWQAATVLGQRREFVARDAAGAWYRVWLYPCNVPPVCTICVSHRIHHGAKFNLLTARQREVFDLTVRGLTIKEIAKAIGLTVQRVANLRSEIRSRLDLPTSAWGTLRIL